MKVEKVVKASPAKGGFGKAKPFAGDGGKLHCEYIYNQPNEWDTGCNLSYENWGTKLTFEDEYTLDIDTCPFCNKPIKERKKFNPFIN